MKIYTYVYESENILVCVFVKQNMCMHKKIYMYVYTWDYMWMRSIMYTYV